MQDGQFIHSVCLDDVAVGGLDAVGEVDGGRRAAALEHHMIGRGLARRRGLKRKGQGAGVGLGEVVQHAGGEGVAAGGRRGLDHRLQQGGGRPALHGNKHVRQGAALAKNRLRCRVEEGGFSVRGLANERTAAVRHGYGGDGEGILRRCRFVVVVRDRHADGVRASVQQPGVYRDGRHAAGIHLSGIDAGAVQCSLHVDVRQAGHAGNVDVQGELELPVKLAERGIRAANDKQAAGDGIEGAGGKRALCALIVHRTGAVLYGAPAVRYGIGLGQRVGLCKLLPHAGIHRALIDVAGDAAVGVGGGSQGNRCFLPADNIGHVDAAGGCGRLVVRDLYGCRGHPGGGGKAEVILRPHLHLYAGRALRHGELLRGFGRRPGQRLPSAIVQLVLVGVGHRAAVLFAGGWGHGDVNGSTALNACGDAYRRRVNDVGALVNIPV